MLVLPRARHRDRLHPWYIGVDYASPVAALKITGNAKQPTLTATDAQITAALSADGYDLDFMSLGGGRVCVVPSYCLVPPKPMAVEGTHIGMSGPARPGETWEIVPLVAQREYALTDNGWEHFGEARSTGIQKVLVGLAEVVLGPAR